MKICVLAPSPNPFILGGAEKFLFGLTQAINRYTSHEAELIKIPIKDNDFWGLIDGYKTFSRLDLSHFDMLLTTKYPAWIASHRNHHVYLQHKCRGLYDLYPFDQSNELIPSHPSLDKLYSILEEEPHRELLEPLFSELFKLRGKIPEIVFSFPGPLTRKIIKFLDDVGLSPYEIKSYSAISYNVKNRKDYFPEGVDVKVIHHPSNLEGFYSSSNSFIFTASRMEKLKRIDLLIEAFKKVNFNVKFLIAGTGGQEEIYKKHAQSDPRIKMLGFVSDRELLNLYANAIFVPFIPYDEDYGLITLEAMLSSKPVITTDDSGGPKELITHEETGLIVSPSIEEIRDAMEYLLSDKIKTALIGERARQSVSHINWENTVRELFENSKYRKFIRRRQKIVITTTFSIFPPLNGGQRRIFNLWKNLSREYDIVFLNVDYEDRVSKISQNVTEIVVKRPDSLIQYEKELSQIIFHPAGDISLIKGFKDIPNYIDLLSRETTDASCVILSHPFLYYAVREVYEGPVVYDAHNCEFDMKKSIIKGQEIETYLDLVKSVENDCIHDADFVISVSKEDKLRLKELYQVSDDKIFIVENGADFSKTKILKLKEKEKLKKKIGISGVKCGIFIGSHHGPNIEALNQLEKIAQILSEVLFIIVGTVCDAYQKEPMPNLKLLGPLPETEKNLILSISDVALNPILSGSGSNLKLIEYVSFMIPVVTTTFGIRGFEFTEKHLFISDLIEFPKKILEACTEVNTNEKIHEAYNFAKNHYDWTVLGEKLHAIIKKFF